MTFRIGSCNRVAIAIIFILSSNFLPECVAQCRTKKPSNTPNFNVFEDFFMVRVSLKDLWKSVISMVCKHRARLLSYNNSLSSIRLTKKVPANKSRNLFLSIILVSHSDCSFIAFTVSLYSCNSIIVNTLFTYSRLPTDNILPSNNRFCNSPGYFFLIVYRSSYIN